MYPAVVAKCIESLTGVRPWRKVASRVASAFTNCSEDETDADRQQRLEDMVNTMLVNYGGTEESRVVITTLSPGHFSVRLPAGEKRRRTTAAVGLQTEA